MAKVTDNADFVLYDDFFAQHEGSLEKLQKRFCETAGVYALCLNAAGEKVTDFSGLTAETEFIKQYISDIRIHNIYMRVTESELEDQAVEITDVPNLRLAAVAVKGEDKVFAVWILCGVITDAEYDAELYKVPPITDFRYQITEKKFYHALDFIRDMMSVINKIEESRTAATITVEKSRQEQIEIEKSVRRAETTTEIVSLLDSDESIEKIMADILEKVATYLEVSHAFVSRVHTEDSFMDIVVQWRISNEHLIFDKTIDIDRCWFLNSSKTLAVSYDTNMTPGEREQLEILGIKAVVSMPIIINGTIGFYAAFCENRKQHIWSIEDIKFINDAIRILQNIVVKRIQRNSIASSFASLEAILDNVGSSIYVRDIKTKALLFANRSLRNNFSRELSDGTLENLFESSIPAKSKSGNYEIYHEERSRWYDLYYTRINWVDGRPVSLCAIYDVTEKKMYQKRIEQQAYTDFLTGLYNRMCCERDLAKFVDEVQENGGKGVLCYLDLDDFKHINDTLGHQYGDILLQDISRAISSVDGIRNSCYRMGGDEFVIIVPSEYFDQYDRILEDVKHIFAKPWYLKDGDYYCTMSMGSVVFPDDGNNVSDLIKKADIAMYEAKRSGKNRISKYSDNIDSSSIRKLDMEKSIRDAANENCEEFEVYFQPIIDIYNKEKVVVGAEALVRWNSSKLGFISPSEFIPLAEYLGLITPIGNYVLEKACECIREWNKKGHDICVNVNLSVVQLMQNGFVEMIEKLLHDYSIRPDSLILEITESMAINNMDRTKAILLRIKNLGVRFALDDFGTGYSSLSSIRSLPFDVIKVDQSFVKDLADDEYSKAFIRMIAELGETIGAEICVEGIESAGQYKVLGDMKVRYVQGFYFDKPLPQDKFEQKYIYN